MAGPGIRYWELAHALARKGHEVVILARHIERNFSSNQVAFLGKASFRNLIVWIRRTDCVVQPGRPMSILLSILFQKKIVFDQYDPVIFEFLNIKARSFRENIRKKLMLLLWNIRQRIICRFGHVFLVANDKQKDLLLGQLSILGYTNKLDSVTVLPFGLPDKEPVKNRPVLRGTKINDTDFLLVWGGGIWDWFDPFTLLQALSVIQSQRNDIKIYFPGLRPPNPDSQKMTIGEKFLAEANRLRLTGNTVFMNDEWTPYDQRADYLLEADAGISLHYDSLETRFAFRTRMLDYLWAGLPILSSKGDCWADAIEKHGLGITVPPKDVDALVAAIMRMAGDKPFRERCRKHVLEAAGAYRWSTLAERLITE
jgi:glycosyltransferase involved in cell wall biosynthesis